MTVDRAAVELAALLDRVGRGLVAAYGVEVGAEAAGDVAAWAWEHRDVLAGLQNPGGYLFRVGQSAARRYRRRPLILPTEPRAHDGVTEREAALPSALARLSPRQRTAVLLVHAHGYTLGEAAELLGCSVSTLRNHLAVRTTTAS